MRLLLILPVAFPLLAGLALYLLPLSKKAMNFLAVAAAAVNSALVALLLILRPAEELELLRLTGDIALALRLDGLGTVFLFLIALLWPLAALYAAEYMRSAHHLPRFFCFYTISYGVTAGVALSANLMTLYLFYELLTLATVPLVAHEQDRRSMKAARKYILYSVGGAALSFAGMMMLFSRVGPRAFASGGLGETEGDPFLLAAYLLTFAGFGVKASIFPFHDWLPSAGVAPTPVTALLHAVAVVKSGVFAVIRSTWYVFGTALLAGTFAQYTVLAVSAFTILFGSAMALREQHWKRRLAYSTVSNLSYILFGMALMTAEGLIAALSHMLFHGVMKICLFFCAGTVLCKTEREYIPETEGLGRKMPLTFAVYLLAGLALTGMPPLPGYVSKLNLLSAAAGQGVPWAWGGIIALLLSALLTAAYLLPMGVRAFLPAGEASLSFTEKDRDPGPCMLIPFAVLCVLMLLWGVWATPVMELLSGLVGGGM